MIFSFSKPHTHHPLLTSQYLPLAKHSQYSFRQRELRQLHLRAAPLTPVVEEGGAPPPPVDPESAGVAEVEGRVERWAGLWWRGGVGERW